MLIRRDKPWQRSVLPGKVPLNCSRSGPNRLSQILYGQSAFLPKPVDLLTCILRPCRSFWRGVWRMREAPVSQVEHGLDSLGILSDAFTSGYIGGASLCGCRALFIRRITGGLLLRPTFGCERTAFQ